MLTHDPGTFLSQKPAASNGEEQQDRPIPIPQVGGSIPPHEPGDIAITDFFEPDDDIEEELPYSRSASSDEEEDSEQPERCYPPDEPEAELMYADFSRLLQLRANLAQTSLSEEEIVFLLNADQATLDAEDVMIDRLRTHRKEVQ